MNLKRKLVEDKFRKIRKKHTSSFIYNVINNMIVHIENDINVKLKDSVLIFSKEEREFLTKMAYAEYKNLNSSMKYAKNDFKRVLAESYQRFDNNFDDFIKDIDLKLTCSKGCGYCCHQSIHINFPALCAININQEVIESANRFIKDYKEIGNPCIFLKNDVCSIYPNRPLVCRYYFSIKPAIHCKEHYIDRKPNSFKKNMPIINVAYGHIIDSMMDFVFGSYGYKMFYDNIARLVLTIDKQKWLNKEY